MKKKKTTTPVIRAFENKWVFSLGVVLALFIIMSLLRGWIRVSIITRSELALHRNTMSEQVTKSLDSLQDPFKTLGYQDTKKSSTCTLYKAHIFSTTVECTYQIEAYRIMPQDRQAVAVSNQNAQKLQDLLKQNGWAGQFTDDAGYASLHKLVSDLNKGIDYTPDAAYSKTADNLTCIFDSNLAFASPNPPAIATRMMCSEYFTVLGKNPPALVIPQ